MRHGWRLQPQFGDDLPHGEGPLELLGYELRPLGLVALDLAAIFVEAEPRGLLGVEGRRRKADALYEQIGVFDGLVADFLVVGHVELDADAAALCVYEQRDTVGRCAAVKWLL